MLRYAMIVVGACVGFASSGHAGSVDHAALLASVATYKPMQGFNHIVGDKRFVGYFLPENGACSVTVITAIADDERLVVEPKRVTVLIKAADRAEFAASNGDALGIACNVDADRITVAPLTLPHPRAAIQ
jgi:hypothetical protein